MEDIIYNVTSYLSKPGLAVMARVSRFCFRTAIPRLYRDVDLYQAVAPLGKLALGPIANSYYWTFIQQPTFSQFERFLEYSRYVQVLSADEQLAYVIELLTKMKASRNDDDKYPFPNLRSLKWLTTSNQNFVDISSLMPPSLDHFALRAFQMPPAFLQSICRSLMENRTTLYSFALELPDDADAAMECVSILKEVLERFRRTLTWVQIPEVFNTPSVITRLAQIPNLCELSIGVPYIEGFDDTAWTPQYAGTNGTGNFTSLRHFSFLGTPNTLYSFQRPFNFTSLTSLYWDVNFEPDFELGSFVSVIVPAFPQLTSLWLGNSDMYDPEEDDIPAVQWSSVQSLLALQRLTQLRLHAAQVSANREQLVEFLKSRPTWTTLEIYTNPAIGLQDILLYVQHCPNLVRLGVHLTLAHPTTAPTQSAGSSALSRFRALESINLEYSTMPPGSEHRLARFLYDICEKPPRIEGRGILSCGMIAKYLADLYVEEEIRTGN